MAKHYLLYGHGGSYNHGSEASIRCDISLLRKQFPNCKITLASHFPEQDCYFGLDADEIVGRNLEGQTPQEVYAPAIKQITPETVCLSVGGDMYCYPNWQRYAAVHYSALERGAKSILWSCSVEPSMIDEEMLRAFQTHHLITVREGVSFSALKERGLTNLIQVADIAFLLPPSPAACGVKADYVVINLSPLAVRQNPDALNAYQQLVLSLLEHTAWNIVLIPHVLSKADNDCEVLNALDASNQRVWMAPKESSASELKYIISGARFCVAARTHACVAAYSSGVPTLAVGYSCKSFGIAKDLQQQDFVLDIRRLNSSALLGSFERLVEREGDIKKILSERIPSYRKKAVLPQVIEALQ